MRTDQDAYGHEVYDYYMGKGGYEIVERDDGYVDISSGPAAYFREYKDWGPHMQKAIDLARGRVLDVGCGAGRHALHLQRRGHDVLGIDTSPLAVKVARLRGVRNVRVMPVTAASRRIGSFGTVLMFGNNFGLFGGEKRARWLLARFRGMTDEDGRIIVESGDPYLTENPCHLAYHKLNRRRGRMPGQLRIRVRYLTYATPWFDYLLVSPEEMKKLLKGTGWHVSRLYRSKGFTYSAVIEKD
ncbi:MAG: methyltransferase domain-containing protein [Candidatus Eisenbacteria bacterium]|nr:methyltransferase domain-containing protein [Candidatus Eisenbacteria bacterium]